MSNVPDLSVLVEARITALERNMARANRVVDQRGGQMERRTRQAGKRMEDAMSSSTSKIATSLATLGKGALGGIIGAATIGGLTALAGRLSAIAEGVANIGSEARRAGVTTRTFQEWGHVATQTRIPLDALIDGFKELAIRADEFVVTGKGSGEESFKRLGFTASDLGRRLRDPSALMLEIIGRMERLDKASQIRVADEVFGGTAGERFVELMGMGRVGIAQLIQEANDFGLVLEDDVIAKADEIDRRFKLIASTIGTHVKGAVVELIDGMSDLFDGLRAVERQQDHTIQSRLGDIFEERQALLDQIAEMERQDADPLSIFQNTNELSLSRVRLEELTAEAARLKDILDRRNGYPGTIEETGDQAQTTTPAVRTLANELDGINAAGAAGANGITSFADAVRALKNEIPGLSDQLAELDAKARIETAYREAVSRAQDRGSIDQAERLRSEALSALETAPVREAASKGMLDLIAHVESGRDGYNATLDNGRWTNGPRELVRMTIDEVLALQSRMRTPENRALYGDGKGSSALGRYQIVGSTLAGLKKELGLSGDEFFDAAMQDRMAEQLLRRRGNDVAGLRSEWAGLRRVDADTIRNAYNGTSVAMPAIDPGIQSQRQERADEAKRQAETYAEIIAGAQAFKSEMALEQQALDMTAQAAARLRYEQQLLNDAQRAGIELSPLQRQELSNVAAKMAEVEFATMSAAEAQGRAQEMAREWQNIANSAMKGLISDLVAGKDAGEAFAGVLGKIADQLINMAVDQLFASAFPAQGAKGSAGGSSGNWLAVAGKVVGSLFGLGFSTGGHVRGPGTGTSDSIPARLSDGEFVVNAQATARNRALLEQINAGSVAGFSSGGLVGAASNSSAPSSGPASITLAPTVTVNASGGDAATNADLAKQTSKAVERSMRALVQDELLRAMRPGNVMGRR